MSRYIGLATGTVNANAQFGLFNTVRTGTRSSDADYTYSANYVTSTANVCSMESRLCCIVRRAYHYSNVQAAITVPTNGDIIEVGEYADGVKLWSITATRSGGAWVGAYANIIPGGFELLCNGTTVKIYNGVNTATFTKSKPYGALYVKCTTNGITQATIYVSGLRINVLNSEISGADNFVDEYSLTGTQYVAYYNNNLSVLKYMNFILEYPVKKYIQGVSKQEWTQSGKLRSISGIRQYKYELILHLEEVEVACWRKLMEINNWQNSGSAYSADSWYGYIDLRGCYIGSENGDNGTIVSIDFGSETFFGSGIYNAKLVYVAGNISLNENSGDFTAMNKAQAVPQITNQYDVIRSKTSSRATSKKPQLTCVVSPRNILKDAYPGGAMSLCYALDYAGDAVFQYSPIAGVYPFGPNMGDGPFLVRLIEATATCTVPFHWDFDITLAYESKL